MDYKELFDNKAEIYDKYRPKYADALIHYIEGKGIISKNSIVADIGCGTGILSKQLLDHVSLIYGVEPNNYMLDIAIKTIPSDNKFIPTNAAAEKTTLNNSSIDFISVGQAFHWFDPLLFKAEARRILKAQGSVMLVWNRKQNCELEQKRQIIVNKYRTIKDVFDCSWDKRIQGINEFFGGHYTELCFPNDIKDTKDSFLMRTLSASHALERNNSLIEEYLSEWEDYFDKYSTNGIITIPNKTVAYIGLSENLR